MDLNITHTQKQGKLLRKRLAQNKNARAKVNVDDVKVGFAAVAGLLNWAVNIDIVLQLAISVASLIYISLKIRKLLSK